MGTGTETVDELRRFGLKVAQPGDGYRFSLDPLLLCDFSGVRAGERVIDLGTGCGVIPLILARQNGAGEIVAVELQKEMAELAQSNAGMNGLAERINVIEADLLTLRSRFSVSSFDLVVSNPPYRRPGTGKISPRAGRDLARHESTAGLADFLAAAKYLVRPSGRICFIYHPSRLGEFMAVAAELKLAPLRLRMVHGDSLAQARMFLVELAKGRRGELVVLPPLLVYDGNGAHTAELNYVLEG